MRRPEVLAAQSRRNSFVVMEREKITEAVTADHHFEQAGFKALLNTQDRQ